MSERRAECGHIEIWENTEDYSLMLKKGGRSIGLYLVVIPPVNREQTHILRYVLAGSPEGAINQCYQSHCAMDQSFL